MAVLFENGKTIEVLTVSEWGHLVATSTLSIGLPAFQRSPTWNERRVELLWDSIIRGFPIGALLFVRPSDQAAWKPLAPAPMGYTTRLADQPAPLLLIDGQQRLTSLQLGFRPFRDEDASRLWIDLAPPIRDNKEARKRGRFRLCTRVHPWGVGTSVASRRDARARINRAADLDDTDISLQETWPIDARAPVDTAQLIKLVLRDSDNLSSTWKQLLPDNFPIEPELVRQVGEEPGGIQQVCRDLLRLKNDCMVGICIKNPGDVEDLGEAFSRLNSQGVPMSQEELFFSALKVRWSKSNNVVADIVEDPEAGKLLTATKIVHLATRIAVSDSTGIRRDVDVLTLDEFKNLELNSEIQLIPRLKELFTTNGYVGEKGRLLAALTCARKILQYRPSFVSDPGLPHVLLGHLHWRSWHAVAAWADRQKLTPGEVGELDRAEVLRLILFLHFFVPTDAGRVSRLAFDKVRQPSSKEFPGVLIAASLLREDLVGIRPPDPLTFRKRLSNEGEEGKGRATWPLLANENHLLHWAQRRWLHDWYPRYDPTLYHSVDDLPFDLDHIMPNDYFDGRWRVTRPCQEFCWDGAALRGSIGNMRIWPREANRHDQAIAPDAKLFLHSEKSALLVDEPLLTGRPCAFRVAGDVRMASLIQEDQRADWLRASQATHPKDWSDSERALALRRAVDERRARMYESLWHDLEFGSWWERVCELSEELPPPE